MKNWKYENRFEIPFITLPQWRELGINIAFSTRYGGISDDPFHSLNMGLHVGDKKENVIENRKRFLQVFDGDLYNMVCCQQVHGNQVAAVDKYHLGRGAWEYNTALKGFDAMICNTPGIFLVSFYADCLPIYFFDPVKMVIGIAHSGWKGTIGRIACHTVEKMNREYGSIPENIQVFIGPGIGQCCFEIQPELIAKVNDEFSSIDDIIKKDEKGYRWNLQNTNQQILIQAGVKAENILICDICTSCNIKMFYSYRREKGNTGRMGALIGLRN
jgi:hypothetical protein